MITRTYDPKTTFWIEKHYLGNIEIEEGVRGEIKSLVTQAERFPDNCDLETETVENCRPRQHLTKVD